MQYLTEEEVADITRVKMPSAQARHLRRMGIEAKKRADGTLLVMWDHVRGHSLDKQRATNDVIMDFGALE